MQQTEHYQLNQWDPEDRILRTDFNADNAKLDAALAGKADKAEVISESRLNTCLTYMFPLTKIRWENFAKVTILINYEKVEEPPESIYYSIPTLDEFILPSRQSLLMTFWPMYDSSRLTRGLLLADGVKFLWDGETTFAGLLGFSAGCRGSERIPPTHITFTGWR